MKLPISVALLVWAAAGCASATGGRYAALPGPGAGAHSPMRPGDRVAIKVWAYDPVMTDTFTVSASGQLALPKVGVLPADRMDALVLQDSVIRAYTSLVRDPAVEAVVLRRVGVVGEVRRPGIYYSDLSMTVADVIALAGGVTENGSPSRIRVLRGTGQVVVNEQGVDPQDGIQSGDQIVVGMRNFWARNPALLVSTLTGLFYFVISRIN